MSSVLSFSASTSNLLWPQLFLVNTHVPPRCLQVFAAVAWLPPRLSGFPAVVFLPSELKAWYVADCC